MKGSTENREVLLKENINLKNFSKKILKDVDFLNLNDSSIFSEKLVRISD